MYTYLISLQAHVQNANKKNLNKKVNKQMKVCIEKKYQSVRLFLTEKVGGMG